MFACIPLNPDDLIEQWLKKDQYLHRIGKYVAKCTTKNTIFVCIPLNLMYSLNNKCKKDQYSHWLVKKVHK